MVVDDSIVNLKYAKIALTDFGEIFTVPSAKKMLDLLTDIKPNIILLDIDMPEMDGMEALKLLKASPETSHIPVIFLTSLTEPGTEIEGLRNGAVDYITKPFDAQLLQMRVKTHLTIQEQQHQLLVQSNDLRNFNLNLQKMVKEETEKVVRLQGTIFHTVVDLVESRDDITGGHINRTMKWLSYLLEGLANCEQYVKETSKWNLDIFLQSSMLHDVGKISISDALLKKPGKLNAEEFEAMKLHTTFGAEIIDKISASLIESDAHFLEHARILTLTHHEKWDGTGYPVGLAKEAIPLQGRLMAISDVYDALISKRPYKEPMPHNRAKEIIIEGSGTHFDPVLVEVFKEIAYKFDTSSEELNTDILEGYCL
ncbi:MAG: response regulator [Deltaproteobacteria bacterium]|jgi:putative two-component system response regulator|nr:response regulator [Deltaproteobacteria bacterium]